MKKLLIASSLIVSSVFISGCADDADIASKNLSKAADNFEVMRRIVFYNGITNQYMLEIQGLCSLGSGTSSKSVTVTCKTGNREYKKHQLGLSDNVTYFSEQVESSNVSTHHYRVTFKPQTILPDIDFRGSTSDLPKGQE